MITLDPPPVVPAAASAPRPAPALAPLKLTRILVPTDFSEPALKAVHYAVRLAQQFKTAVTLLHVFDLSVYAHGLPENPTLHVTREDIQRIYDEVQAHAQDQLDALRNQMRPYQLTIDTELRNGTPHEHIVGAAKESRADLIVIATHGYTGFKHLFLGSTAERVVRHAPCPVLVVRENERDFLPDA